MAFAHKMNTTQSIMNTTDWDKILDTLPLDAKEPTVVNIFIEPLLQALGFEKTERQIEFKTGNGNDAADYAARKNTGDDIFLHSNKNPYLLVEAKGRNINLADESPSCRSTKAQLKRYLLSPNGRTAEWGIITNSIFIQLFRCHGKAIVPATENILIDRENITDIVTRFRHLIENTPKALTVCVYNNKGGVGKTTTIINLAAILRKNGKNVLLVDFDSQADTTTSLGLKPGRICLSDCLLDTALDIKDAVVPFNHAVKPGKSVHLFDTLPADERLEEYTDSETAAKIQKKTARLRDLLRTFIHSYDYILIDCPTQWLFFSQSGIYASDVVLIPAKHNGRTSLHNAARVIKNFIPEIQKERNDGGPIALPIFFNGEKTNDNSLSIANSEIKQLISQDRDLLPYFYPKARNGNFDTTIFHIPAYASVANAAFAHLPAVFMHKVILDYYDRLAKEYFLHG